MSAKKASADTATTATTKKAAVKKFPLASLQKNCTKLFGVSTCTFVGATAGLDASQKYSIDEMKQIIEAWSKKGVK